MDSSKPTLGKFSLILAIFAPVFPFAVPLIYKPSDDFFWVNGPAFIWGFEFIAFVLGVFSWRTLNGKLGVAISLIISALLLGYMTVYSVTTTEIPSVVQPADAMK